MARQASAERAWPAISRFYDNCKKGKPGQKGFPRFKKHLPHGSVEYKTTGYKLLSDRWTITFTDSSEAGSFKLWGTRDLHFYQLKQKTRRLHPNRLPITPYPLPSTPHISDRGYNGRN
jgi:putative transposase